MYPGRHCCKTSLRTLSNASVHVVSVTGGVRLRSACEMESGSDILENVVKEEGVFKVWCSNVLFACTSSVSGSSLVLLEWGASPVAGS